MTGIGKLIRVGRVAGAFGVRGEIRITTYTERPLALLDYGPLRREDGSAGLSLSGARETKGGIIARAAGVENKEEADALRGLVLFADRDALPPAEEDEFYLADLIGLRAVAPDGAELGKVRNVQDFGAGDLIEVQPEKGASWWVAFTREAVPEVDIAGGRVVVVRPEEITAEPTNDSAHPG